MSHELRSEVHGRGLRAIPGELSGGGRCTSSAVARCVTPGEILGERLSAGHTVECVHGSQRDFIAAGILQHVLEDIGHGSGVGVI